MLHIVTCVFSLTYSACKGHGPCFIANCDLSDSTVFFHIISSKAQFLEKVIGHKKLVLIFSTTNV